MAHPNEIEFGFSIFIFFICYFEMTKKIFFIYMSVFVTVGRITSLLFFCRTVHDCVAYCFQASTAPKSNTHTRELLLMVHLSFMLAFARFLSTASD